MSLVPKGQSECGKPAGRLCIEVKITEVLPLWGMQCLETGIKDSILQLQGTFNRATGRSTDRRRKSSGGMSSSSRLDDANACGAFPGSSRVLNYK